MIEKFHLFNNGLKVSYLIGPKGFNNKEQYSFQSLKVWRFYKEGLQIYFITSQKEILAYFSKGEVLLDLLQENGVSIIEMEIEKLWYDDKTPLPQLAFNNGSNLVTHIGDSRFTICYLIDKNQNKLFHYPLDKGLNHNIYQEGTREKKLDELYKHLYQSEIKLVGKAGPDSEGKPPQWMLQVKTNKEGFQRNVQLKNALRVVLMLILALLMYLYT